SARAPSTCGELTSACCCSSTRSAVASPFITASATSLWLAAADIPAQPAARMSAIVIDVRMTLSSASGQLRQPVGAVALLVLVDAVQVEHRQQQVSRRDRLAFVREVPIALQLSVRAADEDVRHVVMLVLIRVPHVRAVHDQRPIEQRLVA